LSAASAEIGMFDTTKQAETNSEQVCLQNPGIKVFIDALLGDAKLGARWSPIML
jgi:hypothetical protein